MKTRKKKPIYRYKIWATIERQDIANDEYVDMSNELGDDEALAEIGVYDTEEEAKEALAALEKGTCPIDARSLGFTKNPVLADALRNTALLNEAQE